MAEPRNYHFIGICGTAMGAVAAALRERGCVVTGSDESVYPPMSTFLESKGIALSAGYRPENIPAEAEIVVIGNAMKRGNPEVEAVLNRKLYYASLPEVLKQLFLRGRHNLVVTGTHGKTTTTALLAWILTVAKLDPSYVIGGIPKNLGQGARFNDSKYLVIEGDEYDSAFFDKRSKFVHYLPELLIVNNIEFDHADIFNNLDEIKLSFRRLFNIVPQNGMILLNAVTAVDGADRRGRLFAQLRSQDFRCDLYNSWVPFFLGRRPVRRPAGGRIQCAQRIDGDLRRSFLRSVAREDPRGAQKF
jgi:UDP-N-acetylmuramate: L-alanyl-gamma-D-glutamyl-meso-diaminopimelate ligase